MRIINLKLENFQGIKFFELKLDGQNADIFGQNASGKTTIRNAHCWLFLNRAGDGIKNYTPKTNDGEGGYVHNLEHSAEETVQHDDSRLVTYKKVYHEVCRKKNGTVKETFEGNKIDYFINNVPTPETEYLAAMASITGDVDKLKVLTIPEYFPSELPWEKRRKILLSLCGDITDEDVINNTKELAELNGYLLIPGTADQKYTIDDYRKIVKAEKAKINKRIDEIPSLINEAGRAIPNTSGYSRENVNAELLILKERSKTLNREKAESQAPGTAIQAARAERQNAEAALNDAKSKFIQDINIKNAATVSRINELVESAAAVTRDITTHEAKITNAKEKAKQLEEKRTKLIDRYNAKSKEVWNPENETCPTCKRVLPADEVNKLREEFNLRKSKDLEAINMQGKAECSKDMITEQKNIVSNSQTIADSLRTKHQAICAQIDAERAKIIKVTYEETPEYQTMHDTVMALKQAETEAVNGVNSVSDDFKVRYDNVTASISDCEKKLFALDVRKTQLARMEELAAEQKQLGAEDEKIKKGLYLCDMFIREKVNMLTDNINSYFENVRFRLFIEQVNGGLQEDCEVMIPSPDGNLVPYSTANGGAKIIAGIEIIKVLSDYWDMNVPLFVDNAESITSEFNTVSQMIRLIASKSDTELRVEVYGEESIDLVKPLIAS